jgi:hypothetical protein
MCGWARLPSRSAQVVHGERKKPNVVAGLAQRRAVGSQHAFSRRMIKKVISILVVTFAITAAGTGCRSSAGVRTANHSVGVGAGVH